MTGRRSAWITVAAFLLPNLVGFALFTLGPVILSLVMAFTNWSLKPAVAFEVVGFRNFADLLGAIPLDESQPTLAFGYAACAFALVGGAGAALWGAMAGWSVRRLGACLALCAAGGAGLGLLHGTMWQAYEPRDRRFWEYFYNTGFLMLGIPPSIAGSLVLALMLNERFPDAAARRRAAGTGLLVVAGIASFAVGACMGHPDMGLLAAVLWGIAALGAAFNVVAFRTVFYLPAFTSGVALMILWKALYNPETGPINAGLRAAFSLAHIGAQPPQWLASVTWAKPALIVMGVWTAIGGTNMLLYLAGLANVSRELLDAAEVDGAGAWARFKHVIWPQLLPTTFFITVMSIIGGFQGGFEQARVMTGGGPAGSTTTLSYYIYALAFQDLDLGYAAAVSWILFAIIFAATALNWKFGREMEVA